MLEIILLAMYILVNFLALGFALSGLILAWQCRKESSANALPNKIQTLADLFPDENQYPEITVQLPIFNEYFVAKRVIDATAALHYPKNKLQIQILDDSTDETAALTQELAQNYMQQGFKVQWLHRANRQDFKAGALREALKTATGQFIAIFDADFIPDVQFLQQTLPYFYSQPQTGVVQTRWAHINARQSLLTRAQALFLDAHFAIEQYGRFAGGWFLNFNGTAGVWRKTTIFEAGNWQADTLTEDLDLSYRAQLKGWKIVFLRHVLSPAELPPNMAAFKSQQHRWVKGGAETAIKILPKLNKSEFGGVKKFMAAVHLLSSCMYLVVLFCFLLGLPLMLLRNTQIMFNYSPTLAIFLLTTIIITSIFYKAHLLTDWQTSKRPSFWLAYFWFMLIASGLSLHNSLAALQGLLRQKSPFVRTPKYDVQTTNQTINTRNIHQTKHKYKISTNNWVVAGELLLTVYFAAGMALCFYYLDFTFRDCLKIKNWHASPKN
jgi:cellulose synthase/poly-beta-1,6-N-acetylglucosamine synthase-like glycosyltransferase